MPGKKTKKSKKKIKSMLIILVFLLCTIGGIIYLIHQPIKNIYIKSNKILPDKDIMQTAKLLKHPEYIDTYFMHIEDKLLKNDYIKKVKINRQGLKLYIEIEEYKPICIYKNKLVLSSKKMVENQYNIDYVPYVMNNIDDIYDKFVSSFDKVNDEILMKISQIEYKPNDVDKERFLLYMVDSNYVYITLSKTEKINKYNSIVNKLDNKKGIIYLDSGDYVEVKN